jgi:uncharacterized membrane protein (UPF0182 family)
VQRVTLPSPSGGRRLLVGIIVGIAVLAIVFTALSGFFVDLLWFREVGYSQVFWTILRTKIALGVMFGALFFVLLYLNLLIVRRLTPHFRALTPEQEIVERYRLAFEPYAWWLIPLFSFVIALFVGFGVAGQWRTFLLWRNSAGVSFGTTEPVFGRDPAFYVFSLPWLRFVQGWLFSSLIGITVLVALAHYLNGGIRPQAPGFGEKVTPQVKAHLSVLLGVVVLTKAWGYYLGQFTLLTSTRGVVEGASYTDVHAQLPALRLLIVAAIVCAVLFLVNIRLRGWALPVIAVGLLAFVSIVAGAAYPAFVQRFRVAPQELQRERPYIAKNIAATRHAFGLDRIQAEERSVASSISAKDVQGNEPTISNVRVWRPSILLDNYAALQRIFKFYDFADVDVDRYDLDGQRRVVMVAAREVNQNTIPGVGGTWQNQHLKYTHGYGAVVSQANAASAQGQPAFTLQDIPPVGAPTMTPLGSRIYYGETAPVPFVVVNTGVRELDFQRTATEQQVAPPYMGRGGIPIGGFFQRLLFAWRFRDVNLLISGLIDDDSRIMIYRDLKDRVPRAAPFLQFDGDPYAAIVDGRLKWIWDAYTTTDQYPYSQAMDLGGVVSPGTNTPPLVGVANYIRNPVKVVVDAYDGSVTYYVTDPTDPIIQVWENTFPDLFTPVSQAPESLVQHFRYPENLFQVQAARFTNYHVTNPDVFYGNQGFWQVPADPTQCRLQGQIFSAGSGACGQPGAGAVSMRPYYVLMRLPGDTQETFVLILPFTPQGRQNMVAWMAARCDPNLQTASAEAPLGSQYGQTVSFEFPSGLNVDGPTQIFSLVNQDPTFSQERTLLGSGGSKVEFGDLLVIPVEGGLLYVEPVYVISQQTGAIPELKRVLVVNGGTVGIGNTLAEALDDSLGGAVAPPPSGGGKPPPTGGTTQQQIAALLARAQQHFQAAQTALKAGDLATYQAEIEAAARAVAHAAALAGTSSSGGPTPSPSASPSPSPSSSPTG